MWHSPPNYNPALLPNNPPLFGDKGGSLREVVFAEVLAVWWELMMHQRGQHLAQLEEQAFAWRIAVGKHVERETPPDGPGTVPRLLQASE